MQARQRSLLLITFATLVVLLLWGALVVLQALEGWGRAPLAAPRDAPAFMAAAGERIETERPGNLVLRLIQADSGNRDLSVSVGASVNADSVFQVASLSKWVTAVGVMTLIERGAVDLDAPVERYLVRWHLPPSNFDNDAVTIRRLLSHTAGITDGLGYGGFAPSEPVQSLQDSLTHAADASPGADGRVRVGRIPGSAWQYSGGSFALLQLMIEDVSGKPLADYMRSAVFEPLGMNRSSFDPDEAATWGIATAYDTAREPATQYHFSAPAAAGLYTTVADMTRFLDLFQHSGSAHSTVLSAAGAAAMQAPQAHQMGAAIWGLGTILYAPNDAGGFVIGHDGSNTPAINTAVRFDPASGNGIIVFETGHPLLATQLGSEWVFWQTGNVDLLSVVMQAQQTGLILIVGWLVILAGALTAGWRVVRRRERLA